MPISLRTRSNSVKFSICPSKVRITPATVFASGPKFFFNNLRPFRDFGGINWWILHFGFWLQKQNEPKG
jgi:hypothetical protein